MIYIREFFKNLFNLTIVHFFKVLKVFIMNINFSRRRCKICFICEFFFFLLYFI